jgi:hypothetical protein
MPGDSVPKILTFIRIDPNNLMAETTWIAHSQMARRNPEASKAP